MALHHSTSVPGRRRTGRNPGLHSCVPGSRTTRGHRRRTDPHAPSMPSTTVVDRSTRTRRERLPRRLHTRYHLSSYSPRTPPATRRARPIRVLLTDSATELHQDTGRGVVAVLRLHGAAPSAFCTPTHAGRIALVAQMSLPDDMPTEASERGLRGANPPRAMTRFASRQHSFEPLRVLQVSTTNRCPMLGAYLRA